MQALRASSTVNHQDPTLCTFIFFSRALTFLQIQITIITTAVCNVHWYFDLCPFLFLSLPHCLCLSQQINFQQFPQVLCTLNNEQNRTAKNAADLNSTHDSSESVNRSCNFLQQVNCIQKELFCFTVQMCVHSHLCLTDCEYLSSHCQVLHLVA